MSMIKLISLLLDYPTAELWEEQQALIALTAEHCPSLLTFSSDYFSAPLLDRQQEWCDTFDRGRATSLLLFEHVHAESRDRGQAMVDLMEQYQAAGLQPASRELPDYLPVYLEYLSLCETEHCRQGLEDIAPLLAQLSARLSQRESPFQELFEPLLAFCGQANKREMLKQTIASEAHDDTPQVLDALWEEEQVKFIGDPQCQQSAEQQHRQRFRHQVAPRYLDLSSGGVK